MFFSLRLLGGELRRLLIRGVLDLAVSDQRAVFCYWFLTNDAAGYGSSSQVIVWSDQILYAVNKMLLGLTYEISILMVFFHIGIYVPRLFASFYLLCVVNFEF